MKMLDQPVDPEVGSTAAVKAAATALDLNRIRLNEALDRSASRPPSLRESALGLVARGLMTGDVRKTLKPFAERHPLGVIAAGAAVGSLAYLVLPRLATGLVVPVLWSEGRQIVAELLHGWLRSAGTGGA